MEREIPEFRKRHSRAGVIMDADAPMLQQVRAGKVNLLREGGEVSARSLPPGCAQLPC
jgi:hypothetical protein